MVLSHFVRIILFNAILA